MRFRPYFITPIFHVTTTLWWNSRFGFESPFYNFMLRRPGSSTFSFFRSPLSLQERISCLWLKLLFCSPTMLINSKLMIFHTDPTEATYRHYLIIDGQSISLDVMDTAGKVGSKFKNSNFCLAFLFILNVLLSLCLKRLCRKSMSSLAFTILK